VRVPGIRTLRRAGGKIKRRLSRRALILVYHRVAEGGSDPWQLAVAPRHFEEHLQVLSKYGRPVPLEDLSRAVRNRALPRRAVAVTFDDGYADNLINAKPLLERHDVPATVFITTGYTGQDREFWWDELDRLFLQPGRLPRALRLRAGGKEYDWDLGETADYDEAGHARDLVWRAWQETEPTARHSVYRSLWKLMHPMPDDERRRLGSELRAWAGAAGSARPTHRALTSEEIAELSRGSLIEVGCHTVTHPQLSSLNADSQRQEISQSKSRLEEVLGRPVTSFAYPYGRECDYTSETVRLVQEAGFDCACTTSVAPVERDTDPFRLPRVQVQDMDGESFARLCDEWLRD
jgi:peptidoglycan/xylan/chitin deacetylase (PgdA/CDA1 family)